MSSDVDPATDPVPILGAIPLEDVAPEPASGRRSIFKAVVAVVALAGAAYGVHGIVTSAPRVASESEEASTGADGGGGARRGRGSPASASASESGDAPEGGVEGPAEMGPRLPGSEDLRLPPPRLWEGDPGGQPLVARRGPIGEADTP